MTTVGVDAKTDTVISPMLMPSYSYNKPAVKPVQLVSVKDGLFHPNLPTYRRMDMDDTRFLLSDQHCRTTTTCGPNDFDKATATLFKPPKSRLSCADVTQTGRHLHRYYTTPEELRKSHEEWSRFLDRAPERFQIQLPDVKLNKDLHFTGYAVRYLRPDITRSWRYTLRPEPMLDQYAQRPLPANIFARYRDTYPQYNRAVASETWR